MKQLVFSSCKSEEDIRTTIEDALEYDTVVENEEAARQWFKDAGIDGDVTTNVILSAHVGVWNEEQQGEEAFDVIVKEHYVDAGSCDYVYSYSIC